MTEYAIIRLFPSSMDIPTFLQYCFHKLIAKIFLYFQITEM